MPELDRYAPYLYSALGITVLVLGGYYAFLQSRLRSLKRQVHDARSSGAGTR